MLPDAIKATFLALVQGITEFLPISSSAHLILPARLFGWEDQGLAFDVAVHLGTLVAVMIYFRRDIAGIIIGMTRHARYGTPSNESRLGGLLILASVPVIVAGFLLKDFVDQHLRQVEVIIATTLLFALVLWHADRYQASTIRGQTAGWRSALIIGLAQVLALVPGTSRSGITMSAAMYCGIGREEASRFSFLLSIPVIGGAALLLLLDLLEAESVAWGILIYATAIAMISAYLCIHFFLRFINRIGFLPFVIYRLALGFVLIAVVMSR